MTKLHTPPGRCEPGRDRRSEPPSVAARQPLLLGRAEGGQASVEYALVLLGAALVATLLIGWATKTDLLNQLFDHVLELIRGKAA